MIISKANKMDDTPFTKHTIDWKEVSFGDFTAHACSVKWEKMLMSVITVNSEIIVRILFSQIALRDILVM